MPFEHGILLGAGRAAAASTTVRAGAARAPAPAARQYARVKLTDAGGKSVKLKSLKTNYNYVFNYPYASTPCFLLNLDAPMPDKVGLKTESGLSYDWPGGVGEKKTLVAYSAICAH